MATAVVIGKKRNGGSAWLYADAAASFRRMLAAGLPYSQHEMTDAGRTWTEQNNLYLAYLRGELKATASHPNSPYAYHVKGNAIDVNGEMRAWIRKYGHRYGWLKDTVPNEEWHMVYYGKYDEKRDAATGSGTQERQIPDMVIIQIGSRYRVISGDRLVGVDPKDVDGFAAAGVPVVKVSNKTWENFRAGFTPEG